MHWRILARNRVRSIQDFVQQFDGMTCLSSGAMFDLLSAGDSRGQHFDIGWRIADNLEQAPLPDFHGELIVFDLKAKRPGHPAATGIYLLHFKTAQFL